MQNSLALEYALHSLFTLGALPDGMTLSVKQLAGLLGVTPTYLAKLFTQLSKVGLVRTAVGSKGGVSLARPADEITAYDVFLAVNGRPHMFQCANIRELGVGYLPSKAMCGIHALMWEAEEKMFEHLRSVTVADLIRQTAAKRTPEERQYALQEVAKYLNLHA